MSISTMSRVWENSGQSGSALLVLLALADRADEDGIAWPGLDWLRKRSRLSDTRQIRRILRALEDSGELYTAQGQGRGNTSLYLVRVGMGAEEVADVLVRRFGMPIRDALAAAEKPDISAQKGAQKPGFVGTKGGTETRVSAEKLDISAQKGVPVPPDPTLSNNSLSLAPAAPEFSDPRIISEDPPQGPKNRGLELPIDLRQLQGNHYPPGQGKNGYQVYREFFDYIPGRSVIQEMNRVVGADPASLQRWRDVLFAYDLSGKASNWVKVQLEWFRDGIPAAWDPNQKGNSSNAQPATNSRNGNTNGAKPRPALGPSVLDLPESEQQRIAALLAGRRPAAVAAD